MSLTDHAIWWHVYPLGFTGAPIREREDGLHHRLGRLTAWLDYAVALGASGLALGPIFASATHGYDTLDHYRIDPRLGDEADFDRLLAACRERGLSVLLDGVFNHVAAGHPWVAEGLAGPAAFEGHDDLLVLHHDDPAVADRVTDVMCHWLGRGIAGWRLDAAYATGPDFWARVLPRVRERFPDAWIMAEVIHGDYAGFVARSGVDSLTQYELWKAIWSSLADRNFFELAWALERHNGFLDHFVPATFVGNHDVTRIATRVGPTGAVLAVALLMTIGGVPMVYAGDEQGFVGTKRDGFGGDDEVRPAFPDSPGDLSPLGWPVYRVHQDLIGLRRRHPWLVRARTVVDDLANERVTYRSLGSGAGEEIAVELDVAAGTVRITDAGGEVFRWG